MKTNDLELNWSNINKVQNLYKTMKIGTYEIPDFRLPTCIIDIKKIYDNSKFEKLTSKDLSQLLGYKAPTSGTFYMKMKSLNLYGLLESRGGNYVTELGYKIAYPDSPEEEDQLKKKAVFHVPLWKQLYRTVKAEPPTEFWLPLKNAAGIDAPEARKHEVVIRKWYLDDIGHIPKDMLDSEDTSEIKTTNLNNTKIGKNKQQVQPQPVVNSLTHEMIQFGNASLSLPKKDLRKQWEKLQKYMEIYLEDYQENSEAELPPTPENEDSTESGIE